MAIRCGACPPTPKHCPRPTGRGSFFARVPLFVQSQITTCHRRVSLESAARLRLSDWSESEFERYFCMAMASDFGRMLSAHGEVMDLHAAVEEVVIRMSLHRLRA